MSSPTVAPETHLIREYFGYGGPFPIPDDLYERFARSLLIVVGADGELSPREWDHFMGHCHEVSVPRTIIDECRSFEYRNARPGDHVNDHVRRMGGNLLYNALRIARSDGVAPQEHEAGVRTARLLGVDVSRVDRLLDLIELEHGMTRVRHRLFAAPGRPMGQTSTLGNATPETHHLREFYGYPGPYPVPRDLWVRFGKAILVIARADGKLSSPEWSYFLGHCYSVGMSKEALAEVSSFDYERANPAQIIDARVKEMGAMLLYAALRVSRADGVAPDERDMARRMAKSVDLDTRIVDDLLDLIQAEDAATRMRHRLFAVA